MHRSAWKVGVPGSSATATILHDVPLSPSRRENGDDFGDGPAAQDNSTATGGSRYLRERRIIQRTTVRISTLASLLPVFP
jgi:hypothetical protein